jgi:ribose transport system permease protein
VAVTEARAAGKSRGESRDGFLSTALLGLRLGPAVVLFLLCVVISTTTPVFLTSRNIGNVLSQTAVIAVIALGQLLVIITRGIDLSVGSTIALSSVVGAIVYLHVHSSVVVILAILATGVAVGAANGVVYVFGKVPHAFIVTLASLSIVSGIALWAANGQPVPGMPHAVQVIGGGTVGWLPYSTFVVAGLTLAVLALCSALVWGRWLYAVGGNPDAARRTGVPARSLLVSVYVISGFMAGVGGLITAGMTNTGSPTFGEQSELDSIAAVIIGGAAFAGGRGNVGNALVGAFTIGVIRNALNLHAVNAYYQLIVIGLVIVLAVEADVIRGYIEGRLRLAAARRADE